MLKRATPLLLLVVFLVTIMAALSPRRVVYADNVTGTFVDRVYIRVGGDIYFDKNPFDTDDIYAHHEGNSDNCDSNFDINDGDFGRTLNDSDTLVATIHYARVDTLGKCIHDYKQAQVTLSNVNARKVTAYKISDDLVFMPSYRYRSQPLGTDIDGDKSLGFFKQYPKESQAFKDHPNVYDHYENGQWDNFAGSSANVQWVDWAGGKYGTEKFSACLNDVIGVALTGDTLPGDCTTGRETITFANDGKTTTPDAALYGAINENTPGNTPAASTAQSGDTSPDCESTGVLSWLLCSVFNVVSTATDWLFSNLVEPLLHTTPVSTDSRNGSFRVWSNFRVYGNIFLILALLLLVFGQAIGGGLIDAYTAKKMAPRILIAAVLINLSIYIVAFLVDITNIVGAGIGSLMIAPFKDAAQFQFSLSGLTVVGIGAVGIGGGLITTWAAGVLTAGVLGSALPAIGLFVLLPAVLGLLGAFVTLVIRQGLILFLILSSPVAFALYCLPNTEKYFRKWWELFFKTLLVYPIVIAIFAIADILTVTIQQANGLGSHPLLSAETIPLASGHVLAAIIAFVLQFLPLLLIPFAFKFAGGAIGSLYATLSGHSNRLHDAIKGNVNDPNSLRNKTKRTLFERITRNQDRVLKAGEARNAGFAQRKRMRFAKVVGGNVNSRLSRYTKEAAEREEQESATGNDDYRYQSNWFSVGAGEEAPEGLTSGGVPLAFGAGSAAGHERFFDSKGREINRDTAVSAEARHGNSEHNSGRNLEYALRKSQTDNDLANFRRAFASKAVRLGLNQGEVAGAWARSTFEHKDKFSSEWFSKPRVMTDAGGRTTGIEWDDVADNTPAGRTNQNAQVNEKHKSIQTFQASQLRDVDWRSWSDRRNRIQDQIDTGAAITNQDAEFYAESDELLDAISSSPSTQVNPDGEVQVAGASAAAQGVIGAMLKNRRYRVAPEQLGVTPGGDPVYSTNTRVIYNDNAVGTAARGSATPGSPAYTVARDAAIQAHAVPIMGTMPPGLAGPATPGRSVAVTGDSARSTIPRQAP